LSLHEPEVGSEKKFMPLSAGMLLRKHDGTALQQQQQLVYENNIHQPLI
jgi:hypothetical protein